MTALVERSSAALRAFRQIVSELRKSDKSFNAKSPAYEYLRKETREYATTQKVWSKAPNEVEHVAGVYAQYLASTRRLLELQKVYGGTEMSIENSARTVGLKLPNQK